MKKFLTAVMLGTSLTAAIAQQRPGTPPQNPAGGNPAATPGQRNGAAAAPRQEPKPYKEVITDKAISHPGLFTVHRVEDKWYFEIPDSIFDRDILVSTRYDKTSPGGNYGGEQVSQEAIRW